MSVTGESPPGGIGALMTEQFLLGTGFQDMPGIENRDGIGAGSGRGAMRDYQRCGVSVSKIGYRNVKYTGGQ